MASSRPKMWYQRPRLYLYVLLLGVILYLFLPQVKRFNESIDVLMRTDLSDLALAFVLLAVSYLVAATVYMVLALHPIRYKPTVVIELASAFANRLLPAGLGGLGVHGLYLHRRKHTVAEATAVVSANNALGISGHLLLLAGVLVFAPHELATVRLHVSPKAVLITVAVVAAIVLVVLSIKKVRLMLSRFGQHFMASLRQYFRRPHKLFAGLGLAMVLTLIHTTIFYVCCYSLGINLSVVETFLVFTTGVLFGTATPTPGGLVGAEAGLFAGLIAFDVDSPTALTAVLLFRGITYWFTFIPGSLAFVLARKRRLI